MMTQDKMVFHGMQFGGRSRGFTNASLPSVHDRSEQQYTDIQQVIYNFLFAKKKVPLYVRGPPLDQVPPEQYSCMAQRVVSKMPPFKLIIQNNKTDENSLESNSGNTNCNESTTAGNFEINFVEFDGMRLVRNDESGHVVILNSNVTLQLPFLFYGNFPPIKLDIYSRSDRWVSINSPAAYKYTREDALAHKSITPTLEIMLAFNMSGKDGTACT